MKKLIIENKWEYEIEKSKDYGFELKIFKNSEIDSTQDGFVSEESARIWAREHVIGAEFGIDRLIDEEEVE